MGEVLKRGERWHEWWFERSENHPLNAFVSETTESIIPDQ
jgi:hypothetical protein